MKEIKLYDMEEFSVPAIKKHGDCFRACVKTLFQLHEPLPHPIGPHGRWNEEFLNTLEQRGLLLNGRQWVEKRDYSYLPRVVIASGPTQRTTHTEANHAVLWDRIAKRMIHDPHPSRVGLLSVEWFHYFESP